MSLAKVTGVFRLTRDAELIYTASGTAALKMGLACSEKYADKETQLFLDAVAFGKMGEVLNTYAGTKGTQIFLNGKLQTESWEKDGKRNYKTSMIVEGFDFISNKPQQQSQNYRPPQQQKKPQHNNYQAPQTPEINIPEDELPF